MGISDGRNGKQIMNKKESFFEKNNPLKDYQKDDKGKYRYIGKLHKLKMTEAKIKSLCQKLWTMIVIMIVCWIICGFIPFNGLMHNFLIVVVYCFELIGLLLLFWAMFTFSESRFALTNRQYKKSVENFPIYTILIMFLVILDIILGLIFIIKNGFEIYYLAFVMMQLLLGSVAAKFFQITSKLKFVEEYNDIY